MSNYADIENELLLFLVNTPLKLIYEGNFKLKDSNEVFGDIHMIVDSGRYVFYQYKVKEINKGKESPKIISEEYSFAKIITEKQFNENYQIITRGERFTLEAYLNQNI